MKKEIAALHRAINARLSMQTESQVKEDKIDALLEKFKALPQHDKVSDELLKKYMDVVWGNKLKAEEIEYHSRWEIRDFVGDLEYNMISEKCLLNLVKNAKWYMAKDEPKVTPLGDRTCHLASCMDYNDHRNDTLEDFITLYTRKYVDGILYTNQRFRYYKNGHPFDSIVCKGYYGGYTIECCISSDNSYASKDGFNTLCNHL